MNSDLTFITNEPKRTLLDRFSVLIKDTEYFDVLVGYFFSSGFYALYKSLETTEKIRILIGINTNRQEAYLKLVIKQLEEGGMPKQTAKKTLKEVNAENGINPLKILAVLQKNIPAEFLKEHIAESAARTFGPREVILSEYLVC